jgi:spore germination protein KC
MLGKIQHDYQADILGLGEKFYEKYPHAWNTFSKNWRSEYSHMPVNIDIDLRVHRTGLKN